MDLSQVFSELIRIDGLDIWEGLSHMCCNKEVYADALKTFCGDLEKKSASLAEFLKKENWKDYTATIHAIKGGLAGIGAWCLAQKAQELEFASRKVDYDFCRNKTAEVLNEIGVFAAALRSSALFTEEIITQEQVSVDYLEKKLNELYTLCSFGSSIEASALADELKTKTCGEEIDAMVDTICAHVENLDYHLVLQILSGQSYIRKR